MPNPDSKEPIPLEDPIGAAQRAARIIEGEKTAKKAAQAPEEARWTESRKRLAAHEQERLSEPQPEDIMSAEKLLEKLKKQDPDLLN